MCCVPISALTRAESTDSAIRSLMFRDAHHSGSRSLATAVTRDPPARISWLGDRFGEGCRWNIRGCPDGAGGVAGPRSAELSALVLAVAGEAVG